MILKWISGSPLFGNQILSYPNIIYNIDRDKGFTDPIVIIRI